jgi:hydrogenase-4 component B
MVTLLPGLIVGILCVGGLLVGLLPLRPRAVSILALVAGLIAGALSVWLAVQVWLTGPVEVLWLARLPSSLPASLSVRIDALGALFLVILGVVPAAALLFSVDYLEGESAPAVRRYLLGFLALLAGMQLVVMAADWVLFLFAWECMNLAAYLLMAYRWQDAANPRAAWVYLVTTHVASGGIILGACALSLSAGDFSIAGTALALQQLFAQNPGFANLLVGLFAVGFAAKAAVFPLSFWLPGAYAAAPSPVSAVLSGVMAKMGIYGLIRLFIFMLPPDSHRHAAGLRPCAGELARAAAHPG